jgi:hypothetical protein
VGGVVVFFVVLGFEGATFPVLVLWFKYDLSSLKLMLKLNPSWEMFGGGIRGTFIGLCPMNRSNIPMISGLLGMVYLESG